MNTDKEDRLARLKRRAEETAIKRVTQMLTQDELSAADTIKAAALILDKVKSTDASDESADEILIG